MRRVGNPSSLRGIKGRCGAPFRALSFEPQVRPNLAERPDPEAGGTVPAPRTCALQRLRLLLGTAREPGPDAVIEGARHGEFACPAWPLAAAVARQLALGGVGSVR